MYTFKQNMSKEVCVAWWRKATFQLCNLRAARPQLECLPLSDSRDLHANVLSRDLGEISG